MVYDRELPRDRNGKMRAVSMGYNNSGAYLTLYYETGKVAHFIPSRLIDSLAEEVNRRETTCQF